MVRAGRTVDFLASLPGPAEALIPVIGELRRRIDCRVFGLSTHPRYPGIGGSLRVFRRVFPDAIDVAAAIDSERSGLEALLRDPPDLLVLGAVDDPGNRLDFAEKEMLSLAHAARVTTVQYIDNWFAWPASSIRPDHMFVIDSLAERIGRQLCPGAESFFVSGHPGLQQLYQSTARPRSRPAGAGPICYFTQIDVDTARTLDWLSQTLVAGDSLLVKNHPRDRISYEGELARFNCKAAVVDETPEALFSTIGQTVTHTSVVGLKSAVLSIPTVNVMPREFMPQVHDLVGGYPLSVAGFSREVRSLAELGEAVRNPRVADQEQVIDHFHIDDASERFVARIVELL